MTLRTSLLSACALSALSLALPAAHAQTEVAQVISSIPVIQQVAVPRQVCTTQQVMVEQPKSGAGAAMGAIAGGAVGNQIGSGSGRAVATIAGIIGGAMLGDRVEGAPTAQAQERTTCTTQTVYENRTVGYNVTYEYAGRRYQIQLPQDPGPTLPVQVSPVVPGRSSAAPAQVAPLAAAPVIYQTAPATLQQVVVREAAPVAVWGAPAISLGFYGGSAVYGGYTGYAPRHHHWR